LYFGISFPERLSDDVWFEKMRQIEWLSDKGLLGIEKGNKSKDGKT
jgi:hypothetical protein